MGPFFSESYQRMQCRIVLLLAFTALALGASRTPEDVVAEPVAPLEEFVQDPEMDKLTHTMKGAVVTNDDEASAHKEPSDVHDEVQCAEGQVICPDGSCAAECPDFVATASFKEGAPGLSYTFPPNPTHLAAAPAFKSASQAHDAAVTEVKKAQLAEKAQENV